MVSTVYVMFSRANSICRGPLRQVQRLEAPVVERAVVLELERADRVRDALDRVRERVRVVVHRVDAPRVARAVVGRLADAVERRVAHVHVRRRHVDLRAQRARAVGELAGAHAAEEVEVLRDGAIAVRAVRARLGERAAVLADLLGREVADVGLALLDQLLGRTRRASRSSPRRRRGGPPSRSRASARPPGSTRRTRRPP